MYLLSMILSILMVGVGELAQATKKEHKKKKQETKVLVLYTGGTIGMVRDTVTHALTPKKDAMEAHLRENKSTNTGEGKDGFLLLPKTPEGLSISYKIMEFDPLLDSSNMAMEEWVEIGKEIERHYESYDGFVVLHGTDTLVYTASALSYMLENLSKPVVVTGSQIPCYDMRTDGMSNIIGALCIAGSLQIPEVMVYFYDTWMRGNRAYKKTCSDFNAFVTPNFPQMGEIGVKITPNASLALPMPDESKRFRVQTKLCKDIVLFKLYPGMTKEAILGFLNEPVKGIVLECFGAGNFPSNKDGILEAMKEAYKRGVIIASVTQCSHGAVTQDYEAGQAMAKAGVIPCGDMTNESVFAKMSYLLGKYPEDIEKVRGEMKKSIRGEMTENQCIN